MGTLGGESERWCSLCTTLAVLAGMILVTFKENKPAFLQSQIILIPIFGTKLLNFRPNTFSLSQSSRILRGYQRSMYKFKAFSILTLSIRR